MHRLFALLLLAACGAPETTGEVEAPPPTWNGQILALMEEHCVSCHVDGGVGPMPLDTYESMEAQAPSTGGPVHELLVPYIESGLMPPYGAMSECIDYAGSHSDDVDADELDLIRRWIDADRPLGTGPEVHYQPPPSPADALGPSDHIVRRDTAYLPSFGSSPGSADYACFMIDPEFTETKWISAITPHIDNKRIVHHMLLFRAEDNGTDECHGEEMFSDLIAGWAPGQDGWFLPEGVAFKIEPGDVFALQIHYDNTSDNGKDDRSGMNLYFTDDAEHEAGVLWTGAVLVPPGEPSDDFGLFRIPAGEANHEVRGTCTISSLLGDVSVFGAWPHMHLLGKHLEARTEKSGVDECLVDVRFSFDDQRGYQFDEPVQLSAGDKIHTTCTFDNSDLNPNNPFDPPRDISEGEGTNDEMCLNFLMYWPAQDVQYCLF